MLFPNIGSEILYLFLLKNSGRICERPKRNSLDKKFFVHFPSLNPKLKVGILLIYQLIEQNLLDKTYNFTFFLTSNKAPKISFFHHPHFGKNRFLDESALDVY